MKVRAFWWGITGVALAGAMLYGLSRPRDVEERPMPIAAPDLTQAPIRLRVAHAVNPRLPRLSTTQVASVLTRARLDAERYFGVHVTFDPPIEMPIGELFARISPRLASVAAASEYSHNLSAESLLNLRAGFDDMLADERAASGYRGYLNRALLRWQASGRLPLFADSALVRDQGHQAPVAPLNARHLL